MLNTKYPRKKAAFLDFGETLIFTHYTGTSLMPNFSIL